MFHATDMISASEECLIRLKEFNFSLGAATIEQLIGLYCYIIDLGPFNNGEMVALSMMQKHRKLIAPATSQIPALLGRHSDRCMGLIAHLIENTDSVSFKSSNHSPGPSSPVPGSLADALAQMHVARETEGDFEIAINGCATRKVHSFVMYSVWPYFRLMCEAGMAEKQTRRLVLPGANEDGCMDEAVLDLIIEVGYKPDFILKVLRERLNVELAIAVLSVSELYLRSSDKETRYKQLYNLLVDECARFALKHEENYVLVFQIAKEHGMADVALKAKSLIISKLKQLMEKGSQTRAQIEALPKATLIELFSSFFEAQPN
jgi:hypothetical protein